MSGRTEIGRREFIKATAAIIGGVIGAILAIPSVAYLLSPSLKEEQDTDSIDLGRLEKYPVGMPTRFEFTRTRVNGWERTASTYGIYVVRNSAGDVRAFSDICTHLGCRVTWHADQKHYISPCHDGHFDIVGNVVSGPPPRPLDEFVTKIQNGNLFVQLPPIRRDSHS